MSDRCEVLKKFNRLFGEFRDKQLHKIGLSEDEKKGVNRARTSLLFSTYNN